MSKFIIQKDPNINESIISKDDDSQNSNDIDEEKIIINNNSNNNKMYKIGRISLDEKSLTRAAIVKLSLLNYSIKKITKILKVSRMLAWKWIHFEKFESTPKKTI